MIARNLLLLAVGLTFGCSSPVEKVPNNTDDQCGIARCPDGYTQAVCEPAADDCIDVGDARCPATCELDFEDGSCTNMAWSGTCSAGFTEVDSCDGDPTCVTAPGCDTSYDVLCVRTATLNSTIFDECEAEDGGACYFNPDCSFDEDCVLVPAGSVCGCLDCETDSVHRDAETEYRSVLADGRDLCDSLAECGEAPCQLFVPHCDLATNRCVGREAKYVTITGLPTDCEVPEDCAAVFTGEVCDACQCPNAAVRADVAEDYATAFDVDCAHNLDCSCAMPDVQCTDGQCVLGG